VCPPDGTVLSQGSLPTVVVDPVLGLPGVIDPCAGCVGFGAAVHHTWLQPLLTVNARARSRLQMLHRAIWHIAVTAPSSVWAGEWGAHLGRQVILPCISTCRAELAGYTMCRGGTQWPAPAPQEVGQQQGVRFPAVRASLAAGNVVSLIRVRPGRDESYADASESTRTLRWALGGNVPRALGACETGVCLGVAGAPPLYTPLSDLLSYSQWWGHQLSEVVLLRSAFAGQHPAAEVVLTTQAWHVPAWVRWAIDAADAREHSRGLANGCPSCREGISAWFSAWLLLGVGRPLNCV